MEFASVVVKQTLENWSDDKNVNAIEKLGALLKERFGNDDFTVESIEDCGEYLMITISSKRWDVPREFGFDSNGRLIW